MHKQLVWSLYQIQINLYQPTHVKDFGRSFKLWLFLWECLHAIRVSTKQLILLRNSFVVLHEISHHFRINTKPVLHEIMHSYEIINFFAQNFALIRNLRQFFFFWYSHECRSFLHVILQCPWIRKIEICV